MFISMVRDNPGYAIITSTIIITSILLFFQLYLSLGYSCSQG